MRPLGGASPQVDVWVAVWVTLYESSHTAIQATHLGDADGRWGCEEVCHGREGCSSSRGGSYRSRVGWSSSCWSGGCDIGQWMRGRGRGSRDTGALGWYSMHVYVEVPVADRRGHGAAADVHAGDAGGEACGLWAGKVSRGWVCDGFRADGRMRVRGASRGRRAQDRWCRTSGACRECWGVPERTY